jgi:hypothetical protein
VGRDTACEWMAQQYAHDERHPDNRASRPLAARFRALRTSGQRLSAGRVKQVVQAALLETFRWEAPPQADSVPMSILPITVASTA